MKVIQIREPGGPEVLVPGERPVPEPGPGEVLVRTKAAGLNRPDVAQRKGHYPAPPGTPSDIPGLELAGIVERTGEGESRWKEGDEVCALVAGGAYAEYCCVPSGQCLPIPEGFSFAEAASLPETFFTVWSNAFELGGLRPGDRFLVHGGSGGIGTAAIQIASALGCTVFTTAGSEEKCRFCEENGASLAINYKEEDFEQVLFSRLGKDTDIRVVLDMVGGDYTPKNLRLLGDDGFLVMINVMKGRQANVDLVELMRRRLHITGSTLRARDTAFKSALARAVEENIWPLLSSGRIRPRIFRTFPLEEAAAAHALMESSAHMGKIVLEIKG